MSEEQHRAVVFFLGLFVFGVVVAVLVTCSGCGGAAFTTEAETTTDGAVTVDSGSLPPAQDVLLGSPLADAADESPIVVNSPEASPVEEDAEMKNDARNPDAETHDAALTCELAKCGGCLGAPKCCLPDGTCGCNLGGGCT
jgi:hypothetical protein